MVFPEAEVRYFLSRLFTNQISKGTIMRQDSKLTILGILAWTLEMFRQDHGVYGHDLLLSSLRSGKTVYAPEPNEYY